MSCCYISMFYDINRSGWAKFARTFDDYLSYFTPYVELFKGNSDDHMIVFIDDRHITKLQEAIQTCDKITLIPINEAFLVYNIPCWKHLNKEREIMDSQFFKSVAGERISFPECRYPEYTLINHSKIDFLIYTLNLNLTSAKYLCWCDFGFFAKTENIPKTLLDLKYFDLERINYTLINPIEDIDRDIYYTLKYAPEKIGGFFFLGKRDKLYEYQKAYHQSLLDYRQRNICDDDQAMALYTYFKNPDLFSFNTRMFGWHKVFVANQKKEKKVISFCLWGADERYVVGLMENIKLAEKFYPGWECYIYIRGDSLSVRLLDFFKTKNHIKIITKNEDYAKKSMLWRLEPIMDESVDVFISRDVDTRIQLREVMAVEEWLRDETKTLHIMRDHPQHYNRILGGMYGVKTKSFRKYKWNALIETFYRIHGNEENDQHFLEKYLYNMTPLAEKMIHDEMKMYEGIPHCRPFPIPYEASTSKFVGCYIYEDGRGDETTEKVLRDFVHPNRMRQDVITLDAKLDYISRMIRNIFIIHYTKLTERKVMMTAQLQRHGFDIYFRERVKWIDMFDREVVINTNDDNSVSSQIINRYLSPGEKANMMAHEYVLKKCCKGGINLVIEDDCLFKDKFIDNLYHTLILLDRQDWDMCCLGGPTVLNTYPARALDKSILNTFSVNDIEIFTPDSPAPCTVSSMLYHSRGVQKIISSKYISEKPYLCPSDHAIWLANIDHQVNMKWVQPFITYEGSKSDMFKTSFLERGF